MTPPRLIFGLRAAALECGISPNFFGRRIRNAHDRKFWRLDEVFSRAGGRWVTTDVKLHHWAQAIAAGSLRMASRRRVA